MDNTSKKIYRPHDPCKPQLFKIEKICYFRYPTKYVCVPVEWDKKCEKHVCWVPVKPFPPVKVPCEKLKQFHCGPVQKSDSGYAPDGSFYEEDGDMQDFQENFDDGGFDNDEGPFE